MAQPYRMHWRRILSKQVEIFTNTGKVLVLYIPTTGYTTNQGHYIDKFKGAQPIPDSDLIAVNIYGKFLETDAETFGDTGRYRLVKGIITVPMLYKKQLALCAYIDPYLDGSRFKKVGATVDEGRLFVTQRIESEYLTSTADVV